MLIIAMFIVLMLFLSYITFLAYIRASGQQIHNCWDWRTGWGWANYDPRYAG